jgi:chemotaxis response regulator CheB
MPETILVIEDEADVSDLIRYHLKRAKLRVLTALDGEDGLRQSLEERPDAVVLDIMLPRLNGFEVAKIRSGFPHRTDTVADSQREGRGRKPASRALSRGPMITSPSLSVPVSWFFASRACSAAGSAPLSRKSSRQDISSSIGPAL